MHIRPEASRARVVLESLANQAVLASPLVTNHMQPMAADKKTAATQKIVS